MPDELYWRLTPVETGALLDSIIERETQAQKADNYRAAFIVSELRNGRRTKETDKVWQPEDFLKGEKRQTRLLGPEFLAGAMDAFSARHNRMLLKERP